MNLFHADPGGLRTRLEQPGTGDARHEFAKTVVVENVDEFGHEHAGFAGASAHGHLVSKIAHAGEAHARDAQMLAQRRNIFASRAWASPACAIFETRWPCAGCANARATPKHFPCRTHRAPRCDRWNAS